MFNPRRSRDLNKLSDAAKASYKQLEPFRKERHDALRQFVGVHYGNDGAPDKVPLNFMQQAVQTYVRKLVSRRPRVRCDTRYRELEPFSGELKDAINESIVEMDLASTLENIVLNALFGLGIAKVGVTSTADDLQGFLHDVGEPFVDCVDLSDWVHDMNARSFETIQFCGNRYELPREAIMANPIFDVAAKNAVHSKSANLMSSMMSGSRHDPHEMEQGKSTEDNDLYDSVELWDYWLPKDGLIVTCTEEAPDKPLSIIEWEGPEIGPYPILAYQKVPNNVMPLPPVMGWLDLHELINALARKAGRQAERQKTVTLASASAQTEAEKVRDAADGEIVLVNDPAVIREMRFGGADAATLATLAQMRQAANYQAGNIDAMAGLSPQSGTVGQDKLLHESASDTLVAMQEQTEKFVEQVCRSIGYHLFTDPTGVKQLQRRVEGVDVGVTQYWGPDRRVGKFFQYNIQVIPYSMRPQTGEQKLGNLYGLLDRFGPMMQLMMQQGYTIDFQRLIQLAAQHSDMPELAQVLVPADPAMAQMAAQSEGGPKMPRNTTREYVRNTNGGQKDSFTPQLEALAASQAAQK